MKQDAVNGGTPAARLSRRKVLGLIGTVTAASFIGELRAQSPSDQKPPTATPRCVVRPQQTTGPYFLDARLNRSDIRSDPEDGSVRPGVPLRLAFRLSRMTEDTCTPLSGAIVDVWHCDARGVYSGYRDFNGLFDTREQRFLRGYQATDADGVAGFLTIYPGWYPGRAVHIHFKIRTDPTSPQSTEFTSQLYFDDAITDQVHARAPYDSRGRGRLRNESDGIFRRGGRQLILPIMEEGDGYAGVFDIGLQTT